MSTSRQQGDEKTACILCGRRGKSECARIECGNRRIVTAKLPDECNQNGWSGVHRRTPVDEESWD